MKKESERLSQEVNQRDTNKLGKLLSLTTLFNVDIYSKSLVAVASCCMYIIVLFHYMYYTSHTYM